MARAPVAEEVAFTSAQPSRHAQYGEHWGEGAARCFSLEADILDEDHAVRLMPVPDSFVCPISAAIMVDPVATVDGCVYERQYIERWFRERRQQGQRITSPVTGLELPSATLMPLVALQRAIEAYLAHRPELKREQMAGRSFEEAAQILQTDLFEKQAVHATTQDKLKRLKHANKELLRALQEAQARIMFLESDRAPASSSTAPPPASEPPEDKAAVAHTHVADGLAMLGNQQAKSSRRRKQSMDGASPMRCPSAMAAWRWLGSDVRRGTWVLGLPCFAALVLFLLWRFAARSEDIREALAVATSPASPRDVVRRRDEDFRNDNAKSAINPDNPAFASQLEQLENGSPEERQRAAFMLRIFAAEHAENQVAIARAGAIPPLVRLLEDAAPGLREEAARALWNLARNNKEINVHNQIAIGEAGAIRPLTKLLEDDVSRVRVVAAAVLNDLAADNVPNQIEMARTGTIAPLVKLLQHDEAPALVMAASLLKSLATNNVDSRVEGALIAAVPPLVSLLKADSLLAQEQAASTLGTLAAYSKEVQVAIARTGAIQLLADRLRGDMMQGTAALALRNLAASNLENQVAIVQAGAIPPLVKLLEDGMPGVREEAARALWNLAMDNLDNQVEIVRSGAAIPLVALLKGDMQEQATITLLNLVASE